jgi:hypothetical protein
MTENQTILYCHCAFARIIPADVKEQVLDQLVDSERPFEAVADLCEMSARKDPRLKELAAKPGLKIAACFPRSVKWLFSSGEAPLPDSDVTVLNMREQSAQKVTETLLGEDV